MLFSFLLVATAFVAELNPSGTALLYSTYFGGSASDCGFRLALDDAGNAYVTGPTSSKDFPITSGAGQANYAGGAK